VYGRDVHVTILVGDASDVTSCSTLTDADLARVIEAWAYRMQLKYAATSDRPS
jgi:hypothetical protein